METDRTNVAAVHGHIWGESVAPLLHLNEGSRFDCVIMSDLVYLLYNSLQDTMRVDLIGHFKPCMTEI